MAITGEQKNEIQTFAQNNNRHLQEIVRYFNRYAIFNKIDPNDIEFKDGYWRGADTLGIEFEFKRTVVWSSIENMNDASTKYSEMIAIIGRGAEVYARTILHMPVKFVRIERYFWHSSNELVIRYTHVYRQ